MFPNLVAFVEVKAPGKKPRRLQARWIKWFKDLGHCAIYVDTRPKVDAFIQWYKRFKAAECNDTLPQED